MLKLAHRNGMINLKISAYLVFEAHAKMGMRAPHLNGITVPKYNLLQIIIFLRHVSSLPLPLLCTSTPTWFVIFWRLFTQFALSSADYYRCTNVSWHTVRGTALSQASCTVIYSTLLPLYFHPQQQWDKGPGGANHGLSPWFVQSRRYAEMNHILCFMNTTCEANKLANRIFQTMHLRNIKNSIDSTCCLAP